MNLREDSLWNLLNDHLRIPQDDHLRIAQNLETTIMNNFEYKYVFIINVRSARHEEGPTPGRNISSAAMPTYCMRSIVIIEY